MRITTLIATGYLALLVASASAAYPEKSIRFIMPYATGGSIDGAGRIVAQKLAENFRQQIVVDNRMGAGGIIGIGSAARAAPDGYTIVMAGTGTLALSPHLQERLPYDPVRDFAPLTMMASFPSVLVVNPSLPVNSAKELIALAKARPGQINYASGGNGSASHLAAELFNTMGGVKLVQVPYKGSAPGIIDVLAGRTQLVFPGIPSVISHIKSGRLRAIGVTGTTRNAAIPDVPTIRDTGIPGYELVTWFGVLAPARTPHAIVDNLNREIVKILRSEEIRDYFAAGGLDPVGNTPGEFATYIKQEFAKWGKFIKKSGMRAD